MDELEKVRIMQECPRFSFCNVPKCPLDVDIDKRVEEKGDERCTMEKNVRVKIGKKYNLPLQGMTKQEFSSTKTWENLPEDKKKEIIERGRRNLPRFHQKGRQHRNDISK